MGKLRVGLSQQGSWQSSVSSLLISSSNFSTRSSKPSQTSETSPLSFLYRLCMQVYLHFLLRAHPFSSLLTNTWSLPSSNIVGRWRYILYNNLHNGGPLLIAYPPDQAKVFHYPEYSLLLDTFSCYASRGDYLCVY